MRSEDRYQGVDAARGLAMVLMTTTHALRALHPDNPPEFAQWLMRIEPITPTLFFLLAGWGLARSRHRSGDKPGWHLRQVRRASGLWLLSAAMFFTYSGPQWPEILTSTGVLQCLGISILVGIFLRQAWMAGLASLVFSLLFLWLGAQDIQLDGINRGSFPLYPFLPIFLAAQALERSLRQRSWLQPALATGGALVVLALSAHIGFRNLWGEWGIANTFQEYVATPGAGMNGFALARDLLNGTPTFSHTVSFWSTLPRLVPVIVSLAGLATLFLCEVADRFPQRLRPLALLGRHALPYYVGHLVLLGAFGLFLPPPLHNLPWSWLFATLLAVGLGVGLFAWRESRGDKP
jgi:peptidoglycan/LPS O-acetylase OafA/YrhL